MNNKEIDLTNLKDEELLKAYEKIAYDNQILSSLYDEIENKEEAIKIYTKYKELDERQD